MLTELAKLPPGKKIYFVSDLHLGSPNEKLSLEREVKMVRWLDSVSNDAKAIFFLGDIFDFWFEYKHVIPKGFNRFLGKVLELKDNGVLIYFFTGNHDMWMFNFFPSQFGIPVYKEVITLDVGDKRFMIGHGDGLGSGDYSYKFLKSIFSNRLCQWLFGIIHPSLSFRIAQYWSKQSRVANSNGEITPEKDRLIQFCKSQEEVEHYDFYVFGHRHQPTKHQLNATSFYYNLGDWINHFTYGEFDESGFQVRKYED